MKNNNVTISNVADWFLHKEAMNLVKLQKLCYYAEAWSEALLNRSICEDAVFEAWVHGAISPSLYSRFHDKYTDWHQIKRRKKPNDYLFGDDELKILESVWMTYGDMSGTDLEALNHSEEPWKKQRIGLAMFEACKNRISPSDMRNYYQPIYTGELKFVDIV